MVEEQEEFVLYEEALALKELGFNKPGFGFFDEGNLTIINIRNGLMFDGIPNSCLAPTYSQAINFLYIYSNKQINIELKASDTYDERVRKINQGCEDLRNLQNNKSNQ